MLDVKRFREAFLYNFSCEISEIYSDDSWLHSREDHAELLPLDSDHLLVIYGESPKADVCAELINAFYKFMTEPNSPYSKEVDKKYGVAGAHLDALCNFGSSEDSSQSYLEIVKRIVNWILKIDESVLAFDSETLIKSPVGFTTYHVDELSSISSEISGLPFRCERLETFMVQYGFFIVANSELSLYQAYGVSEISEKTKKATYAQSFIGMFVEIRLKLKNINSESPLSSFNLLEKLAAYSILGFFWLLTFIAFLSLPMAGYLLLAPFEKYSLEALAVFGLALFSLLVWIQFYEAGTEKGKGVEKILHFNEVERLARVRTEAVSLFQMFLSTESTPLEMVFYKLNKLQLINVPDGLLSLLFRAKCGGDTTFNRENNSLKSLKHEYSELIGDD